MRASVRLKFHRFNSLCVLHLFREDPEEGDREHVAEDERPFEPAREEDVPVFRPREQRDKHVVGFGRVRTARSQVQCGGGYRTSPHSGGANPRR